MYSHASQPPNTLTQQAVLVFCGVVVHLPPQAADEGHDAHSPHPAVPGQRPRQLLPKENKQLVLHARPPAAALRGRRRGGSGGVVVVGGPARADHELGEYVENRSELGVAVARHVVQDVGQEGSVLQEVGGGLVRHALEDGQRGSGLGADARAEVGVQRTQNLLPAVRLCKL